MVEEALEQSNISISDIDYFTATSGPGLIGGLVVGVTFTKTLAMLANKPFIAVNHLAGHALAARIEPHNIKYNYKQSKRDLSKINTSTEQNNLQFPYLLVLISGGHCQLIVVKSAIDYEVLGETLDDALGETFDKVARLLDMPYPGGKYIEEAAKNGNENVFDFPRPIIHEKNENACNFSFSGLKTAVRIAVEKYRLLHQISNFNDTSLHKHQQYAFDICACFQKSITSVLIKKITNAIGKCNKKNINPTSIVISGGVAANDYIYQNLCKNLNKYNIKVPITHLCTDNAAMIAWAAYEMISAELYKTRNDILFVPKPRWSLEDIKAEYSK